MDSERRQSERSTEAGAGGRLSLYIHDLRCGRLDPQRLRLLARLGDREARAALAEPLPSPPAALCDRHGEALALTRDILREEREHEVPEASKLAFLGGLAAAKGHYDIAARIWRSLEPIQCDTCGAEGRVYDFLAS